MYPNFETHRRIEEARENLIGQITEVRDAANNTLEKLRAPCNISVKFLAESDVPNSETEEM